MNTRLITSALALALLGSTGAAFAQYQGPPPPPQPNQGYGQNGPGQNGPGQNGYNGGPGGEDAPPQGYSDVQKQGFHDGMRAARHDIHNGRQPDPRMHPEFRHPAVPEGDRHDYREAFRSGYSMAVQRMGNQGGDGGPH